MNPRPLRRRRVPGATPPSNRALLCRAQARLTFYERQVAASFNQAAQTYAENPTAFHLRAMNMLYEGLSAARDDRSRALDRGRVDAARRADAGDSRQRDRPCENGRRRPPGNSGE